MSDFILSEDKKIILSVPDMESWDKSTAELIGTSLIVRNGHELVSKDLESSPEALAQAKKEGMVILTYLSESDKRPQMVEIKIKKQ